MKPNRKSQALVAMTALATLATQATAVTVVDPYDNSTDGGVTDTPFSYLAKLTYSSTDIGSAGYSTSITPGGWSFADLASTANPDRGWGHTSRWFLVEILEGTDFAITMTATDISAQPGIVIYSGESIDDDPSAMHTFSNNGSSLELNDGWNTNGDLTYFDNAFDGVTTSLSETFYLEPGLYTIGFGNAADSSAAYSAVSYDIELSAVAVPEPSSLVLVGASSLLLLRRRRR